MGGGSVRAFSSHGFLYVFIFIMEKKETVVYNERNRDNEAITEIGHCFKKRETGKRR
jgi:hypothetical protein